MSDYTTIQLQFNGGASATGTDATPVWTGTALAFGGSAGANELRFCNSGGGTSIASASWPYITRPAVSTATVSTAYAYSADSTGLLVTTYTGDNTKARVFRWDWDANGTQVAAPQFSLFSSTAHATPTAGDNSIVGGNSTDTSSTSYMKINAYGSGVTAGGTQETPAAGSVGTNPSATTGTAGSVTTTAGDWLNTHVAWQSAQGWTQYILSVAIPKATTAGDWYWTCVLFTGVNMTTGSFTPVFTLQYTYS